LGFGLDTSTAASSALRTPALLFRDLANPFGSAGNISLSLITILLLLVDGFGCGCCAAGRGCAGCTFGLDGAVAGTFKGCNLLIVLPLLSTKSIDPLTL
jgi:hypothetical protein